MSKIEKNLAHALSAIVAFISVAYAKHDKNHTWESLCGKLLPFLGFDSTDPRADMAVESAGRLLRGAFPNSKRWDAAVRGEERYIAYLVERDMTYTFTVRPVPQPIVANTDAADRLITGMSDKQMDDRASQTAKEHARAK